MRTGAVAAALALIAASVPAEQPPPLPPPAKRIYLRVYAPVLAPPVTRAAEEWNLALAAEGCPQQFVLPIEGAADSHALPDGYERVLIVSHAVPGDSCGGCVGGRCVGPGAVARVSINLAAGPCSLARQSVVTHELGHVLGLGDKLGDRSAIMYEVPEASLREPQPADRRALARACRP